VTQGPPLVVIGGATATGKTTAAIELAGSLIASGRPAAIISADSRQVFRGLDIATAKVGPTERRRVPHHGLDLVDPDEAFSVADFVRHVTGVLNGLVDRGGVAILAGGTGLYLRAVARGLDTEGLPSDPVIRSDVELALESRGLDPLVTELVELAPGLAATVDLHNPRRVVRALEIARIQGDVPRPTARGYGGPLVWVGLRMEPTLHRRRIEERARSQFDGGLLDEAEGLRQRFDATLPAFSAIGYREAWAVLDGETDVEAAVETDVRRTVAFAKRQATWFRSERDISWFDVEPASNTEQIRALVSRTID
jgi:tRNA dimethylallyltransferase